MCVPSGAERASKVETGSWKSSCRSWLQKRRSAGRRGPEGPLEFGPGLGSTSPQDKSEEPRPPGVGGFDCKGGLMEKEVERGRCDPGSGRRNQGRSEDIMASISSSVGGGVGDLGRKSGGLR